MMSTFPLVSILIPLFNAKAYLKETLSYLRNQEYKNLEIIIVDDHSSDGSLSLVHELMQEDERIQLYTNTSKGACSARNYAFAKSTGKYVMFLDADDFCSPGKIAEQVRALSYSQPKTLVFSPLRILRDGHISPMKLRTIDKDYYHPTDLLIDMWLPGGGFNCPHCYMCERELVDESGGWDESVLKNQDGEFFSRVISHADRVICVQKEYAVWRLTNTGISSTTNETVLLSKLDTITKISNVILSRDNSERALEACAREYGNLAYFCQAHYPSLVPIISKAAQEKKLSLKLPDSGRLFCLLRPLIGWKYAAMIVQNPKVIQLCSLLNNLFLGRLDKK